MGVICLSTHIFMHIANDLRAVCDSIGQVTDWFTLGLTLNLPSHCMFVVDSDRRVQWKRTSKKHDLLMAEQQ